MADIGIVVVTGATGRQGGAVTRALLGRGWRVRAMTRDPDSAKAGALAELGAELVRADMDDPAELDRVMSGAYGVYSVQNPLISGLEGEVRQGRNVGEAAHRARVRHLVYGAAGTGERGTGVGSWESKLEVEDYLRQLDLPVTVLRPMAFMELMTDPAFYPAAGVWHVWPKIAGGSFQVPWLSCADLGEIAAVVFSAPEQYIGRKLTLAAELRSLDDCRRIYTEVFGRPPKRFPMPIWLLERFAPDTVRMWRRCRDRRLDVDPELTLSLHPGALTVQAWLRRQRVHADQHRPA